MYWYQLCERSVAAWAFCLQAPFQSNTFWPGPIPFSSENTFVDIIIEERQNHLWPIAPFNKILQFTDKNSITNWWLLEMKYLVLFFQNIFTKVIDMRNTSLSYYLNIKISILSWPFSIVIFFIKQILRVSIPLKI